MAKTHHRIVVLRQRAWHIQHCRCYYCDFPIWESEAESIPQLPPRLKHYVRSTAEHLRARCDGGSDTASNIVAACLWCNSERHRGRGTRAPDPANYQTWVRQQVSRGRWHPVASHLLSRKRERATALV